jgi:hypothetical protein
MEKTSRLVDNGDNTVTDTKTGLQWVKDHNVLGGKFSGEMNHKTAQEECKKLNVGGKKDWRLPTREELLSIVDLTRRNPAVDPKFANTKSSWYWTSTPVAGYSSVAWCVGFDYGGVYSNGKDNTNYVRPVRSSQ